MALNPRDREEAIATIQCVVSPEEKLNLLNWALIIEMASSSRAGGQQGSPAFRRSSNSCCRNTGEIVASVTVAVGNIRGHEKVFFATRQGATLCCD